jgi:small-conductance mechanosensitive channel
LGAFSIAISFATSTIIQNVDSGILVQADKAFQIRDEIKVLNFEVKMVKISIRTTVLETSKSHASN